MISTDVGDVWAAIEAGEKKRDEKLGSLKDQIEGYHGFKYNDSEGTYANPENTAYEYISATVPRMVWNNPRTRIATRRPTAQQDIAEALEWGINRWIRDVDLKTALQEVAVDYLFKWGVMLVTLEPRWDNSGRETEDPPMWPSVTRISVRDFGWDPNAPTFNKARMVWHRYLVDKEDLLNRAEKNPDEKWNVEAIQGLATGLGMDDRNRDRRHVVNRKEVVVHEVWFPELEDENYGRNKGFNGKIFTLGQGHGTEGLSGSPEYIRDERPFYGPRWGPYVLFGAYTVPDSSEPLGPLTAVAAQDEQLNRQAMAFDRANEKYKQLVFVSGDDPDLQENVANGKDMFVFPARQVEDVRTQIMQVAIGGASDTQAAALQGYRERVNRLLGLDEIHRGNVSGEGTATEVSAAVASSENRLGYLISQFAKGAEKVVRTVAWYLYHTDEIIFPLGEEAYEAFQPPEGVDLWFKGGTYGEETGATFDDLELEIDVYSMEKTTESQLRRKGAFLLEFMTSVGPLLPQLEALGWNTRKVLKTIGETENIPDLDEKVNWQKLAQIAQSMPQGVPWPQLSKNVGEMGGRGAFTARTRSVNAQQGLGRGAPNPLPSPASAPQGAQTQPEFAFEG